MIDVSLVARYFLSMSEPRTVRSITHLKLQKLAYYAQGFYFAICGEPLFDEPLEAWAHGPVCPSLYKQYKSYGYSEIPPVDDDLNLDPKIEQVLDAVWDAFGGYTGPQLEYLTHREEPWIQARGDAKPWEATDVEIDLSLIEDYFRREYLVGN